MESPIRKRHQNKHLYFLAPLATEPEGREFESLL
jgi:hypothetical protein